MTELIKKDKLTYRSVYRVIWLTHKKRRLFRNEALRDDLMFLLWNITREMKVTVYDCEVKEDMVDMRIGFDPRLTPHKIIKQIKNSTAKEMRARHPELKGRVNAIWTYSYLLSTEGELKDEEIAEFRENNK